METRKITKVLLQIAMVAIFIIGIRACIVALPKIINRYNVQQITPPIFIWFVVAILLVLPIIVLYLLNKDSKYAGIVALIPLLVFDGYDFFTTSTFDALSTIAVFLLVTSGFHTYACFKKEKKK